MSAAATAMTIDTSQAALLIVDVQERLAAVMKQKVIAQTERNIAILTELARRCQMPVVVSEQYPKGLGPTTSAVALAAQATGSLLHRLEKIEFGVGEAPAFAPIWAKLGKTQWIVTGMESHVCVYQTVRQLRERGATVHVPGDAVISRTKENWRTGLGLMEGLGAVMTSTETIVFDALKRAGTEDFKAMSKLLR